MPTTARRSGSSRRSRRRRRSTELARAGAALVGARHGHSGSLRTRWSGLRHQYLRRSCSRVAARIRMLARRAAVVRRGVEGALRRRRADACPSRTSRSPRRRWTSAFPGRRPAGRALRRLPQRPFVIPREKLDAVFQAAIDGCRERTLAARHAAGGERFTVEYVTNKSWSGYNWYQGDFRSLIQVNTDLPIYIDRAIDLACHEGYPGHHVYNALLEKHLVRGSRLDRVHGLSAVLAAVADRRRHGELRHRGRVSRPRARGVRADGALSGRRSRSRARRRVLRGAGARRPAGVRRQRSGAAVSRTARSIAPRRRRGSSIRAVSPRRAPSSACGSSTSTAATSSTTTWARTWSRRYIESRGGAPGTRRALGGVREAAVVAPAAFRSPVGPGAPLSNWLGIVDELYQGSWNPDLQRFRSPYAFRGASSAGHTLASSLVRLAAGRADVGRLELALAELPRVRARRGREAGLDLGLAGSRSASRTADEAARLDVLAARGPALRHRRSGDVQARRHRVVHRSSRPTSACRRGCAAFSIRRRRTRSPSRC